jgi:hypothetical protein
VDPSQDHSSAGTYLSHPRRIRSAGDIIERRGNLAWQRLVFDSQRRGQLASGTRAEQWSGDAWSVAYPEQSDLEWKKIKPIGCSNYGLHDASAARFEIRLDEPCEVVSRRPRSAWGAIPVLPGQYASA